MSYSKRNSEFLELKLKCNTPKNLCVRSDDPKKDNNPFDSLKCNIGTTFKTGIDIPDGDDLIIVLPSDSKHLGIFSSGSIAVQQALARARKNSNVYVIIPELKETVKDGKVNQLLSKIKLEVPKRGLDYNDPDDDLEAICEYYVDRYSETIKQLPNYSSKSKGITYLFTPNEEKVLEWENLGYSNQKYPTIPSIHDFIVDIGQYYLMRTQVSSGKGIIPYLLWAVANDQITHCTLKSCLVRIDTNLELKIDSIKYCNQLNSFATTHKINITPISGTITIDSYYECIKDIWKAVKFKGIDTKVNLTIDNKKYTSKRENKFIMSALWNFAIFLHDPTKQKLSIKNFEDDYFKFRLSSNIGPTVLVHEYSILRSLLSSIIIPKSGIVVQKKNDIPILNNKALITKSLLIQLHACLETIKEKDPLLSSNGFTNVLKEIPEPIDKKTDKRVYLTIKKQFFIWDQNDENKLIGIKYI